MSDSYTLLKNPAIRNKDCDVFKDDHDLEQPLFYDNPESYSPVERFLIYFVLASITFLFWKNVFQVLGVI